MMNHQANGFQSPPPFFSNGSRPPMNPAFVPNHFTRPPPSFPPRFGPPPGHNGFNNHLNGHMHPNGYHHSGFMGINNSSRFSRPPPPIPGPPPRPQRPVYTPDNIFSPPPQMTSASHEGFPFSTNHQLAHPPPPAGAPNPMARGGRGGRGRGDFNHRGRGGFAHNNNMPYGKKKKERVDKRDLAENNVYFCDTCDRGFKTQEKYQEHIDSHMKCPHKDCRFIAAPKLIQLHLAMQHRSGLAKKVWSVESEEDVKKWREDRKRKFPTAENIAKKKEEQAQRIARGEILHTKDFSAMRGGRGRNRGRGQGGRGKWRGQNRRGRGGRGGRFNSGEDDALLDETELMKDDSDDDAPPEETAIKHLQDEPQEELDKRLEETTKEKENEEEPQELESVLEAGSPNTTSLGLLASYGYSSSDEEGDKNEGAEAKEEKQQSGSKEPDISDLSSEPPCQPSPSKRPRLHPNPFLTQPATSHAASELVDSSTPDMMSGPSNLSVTEISSPGSKASPGDKASGLSSPSKASADPNQHKPGEKSPGKTNANSTQTQTCITIETESAEAALSAAEENVSVIPTGDVETDVQMGNQQGTKKGGDGNSRNSKKQAKNQAKGNAKADLPKYTLLEKLLAPDIRQERNKILQCVHYIVKHKFFDTASAADSLATSSP